MTGLRDRFSGTVGALAATFGSALMLLAVPSFAEVDIDSSTFGGLRARGIGPAVMSGRIAAIDAVPTDPLQIYIGSASGGVWKSIDAGLTFKPIFDDHVQSIGAIRIDTSNPETVWVGTGEPWTRNSVSVGRGVYKSMDGGDNWTLVGLEDTERIGAIRIDSKHPDTVFVCAVGHLWNDHEARGVYKTTDGGESWEKVLYVDERTGCADLDIDPQEPNIVYAAMWEHRREPDFFSSGGPGSGLYKSSDGGTTWKRLESGLPQGTLGRIAVAVAPSRPSTVYATVESEKTALYRSDDVGESWTEVNTSGNVVMRPFYFSELVVDPKDHRRVYKPGFFLTVSEDAGKSFSAMISMSSFSISVHPDHHALWVNPNNPQEVLLGTDGGVYMSQDGSNNWRHLSILPVSQLYHVSHDMEWPYNVFGGLQDNGSWSGPSLKPGGIQNSDWKNVGFGDGFWVLADPTDDNTLYVEYQGGMFMRVNEKLGEIKAIRPFAREGEEKLRFNWNTPMHVSPNEPGTVYYGSQYLHRSRDRGESWETISPDLTTDDPARQRQAKSGGLTVDNSTAENNTTIYSISESPKAAGTIWVGTDDGLVQLTRDHGETWTNVTAGLIAADNGVAEGSWVSSVHASPHDAATAFVTFDDHRRGDMATYVFKTTDHGATWTSLVTDEIEGYAWVIKQDPVRPDILYLGTEFGLYITLDGGRQWARFTENLPKVAVHDIVVHPREHDLILATHGRGIYILDDLTALRALTPEILEQDVALLPNRPSVMVTTTQLFGFSGDAYAGETLPESAFITYYLKKRHLFGDLKIEVYGEDGGLITTLPASKRRGMNRAEWPMRLKAPKMPAATTLVPAFLGPRVLEGKYKIKLIKGKTTLEGEVELVPDPRTPHSAEDRRLQQELALALYHRLADMTYLTETLSGLRDQARERADVEGLRKADADKLRAFADRLESIRGGMVSTSDAGMISGDEKLREHLGSLYGDITSYDGRPSAGQLERKEALFVKLDLEEKKVEDLLSVELETLNALLAKRGLEPLERSSRGEWEAKSDGQRALGTTFGLSKKMLRLWLPSLVGTWSLPR